MSCGMKRMNQRTKITELMEAIQESEGHADRIVLTVLEGEAISEKALVIDGDLGK